MTLTQGWDQGNVLAKWMNHDLRPDEGDHRQEGDVTVVFLESDGSSPVLSGTRPRRF